MRIFILFVLFSTFSFSAKSWVFSGHSPDIYQMMRENNPRFWQLDFEKIDSRIKPFLSFEGYVWGDSHLDNFSLRYWRNELLFIPDDFDDSGIGSFFLEFTRFISAALIFDLSVDKLFDRYLLGLSGEALPDFSSEILTLSKEQLEEHNRENIERETVRDEDGRLKLNVERRFFFALNQKELDLFYRIFPDQEILDSGFFVRTTGGSTGRRSIWLLLDGELWGEETIIFEYKELQAPALNFYRPQRQDIKSRIEELIKLSWPKPFRDYYQVLILDERPYLLRPRLPNHLSFYRRHTGNDVTRSLAYAEYLAHKIGAFQYRQNSKRKLKKFKKYSSLLENERELAIEVMKNISEFYLQEAERMMENILLQKNSL